VSIGTSYQRPDYSPSGLQVLSRLTDRERDAIVAALDTGELVPIVDVQPREGSAIVGALTPDHAEAFANSDPDMAGEIMAELKEARRELDSLREIIRETLRERDPIDYESRLMLAVDDVETAIENARDRAEEI
jgi:phosphate uptake regulator